MENASARLAPPPIGYVLIDEYIIIDPHVFVNVDCFNQPLTPVTKGGFGSLPMGKETNLVDRDIHAGKKNQV